MPSQTPGVRRATLLGATLALAVLWLGAAPLGAQTATTTPDDTHDETTTTIGELGPTDYLNGISVSAGTVKTPGSPDRKLDAVEAATFLRTWLPPSIVSEIPNEKPPTCLPVSTLRASSTFSGVATPIRVFYASDGTNAWVGMPVQDLGFASVEEEKWIRSPDSQGTIAAFNAPGAAPSTTNDCAGDPSTSQPNPSTSQPKPTSADSSDDSSDSNTWLFIVVPAAVIVAGGIWLFLRSRSGSPAA